MDRPPWEREGGTGSTVFPPPRRTPPFLANQAPHQATPQPADPDGAVADPAAMAAVGISVGLAIDAVASVVAGFGSGIFGGIPLGGTALTDELGFRLRLLTVFGPGRIEEAAVVLLGVGLIAVSRPARPASYRRGVLVVLGALAAYLCAAAVVRAGVFASLAARAPALSAASGLSAIAGAPVAGVAAIWSMSLTERRSGGAGVSE